MVFFAMSFLIPYSYYFLFLVYKFSVVNRVIMLHLRPALRVSPGYVTCLTWRCSNEVKPMSFLKNLYDFVLIKFEPLTSAKYPVIALFCVKTVALATTSLTVNSAAHQLT